VTEIPLMVSRNLRLDTPLMSIGIFVNAQEYRQLCKLKSGRYPLESERYLQPYKLLSVSTLGRLF
jgi:hypothetical protein